MADRQPPHPHEAFQRTAAIGEPSPAWTERHAPAEASRSHKRQPLHANPEAAGIRPWQGGSEWWQHMVQPDTGKPSTEARTNIRLVAAMALRKGMDAADISCLDNLWSKESGFETQNAYGDAYGIPQAKPGSKMEKFGSDWQTNPITQVKWGFWYIRVRYNTACAAWGHSVAYGWY